MVKGEWNVTELFDLLLNKIFNWTKLKAFADISIVAIMMFLFNRVENIVGKEENAGYQHFLLFQHFFAKLSFLWSLEVGIVCLRIKKKIVFLFSRVYDKIVLAFCTVFNCYHNVEK